MRIIFVLVALISNLAFAEVPAVKPPTLGAITNGQLATNDLFLLWDTSAGITKKLTVESLDTRYGGGASVVTSVSGTLPIISSGGSTPAISCRTATAAVSGCLAAADFTTFNAKQDALTIGNLSSGTTGVSVSGGTGAVIGSGASISIQTATGAQPGLLSAADFTTFAAKQAAGDYITSLTGDVTASGPGAAAATIASNVVSNSKLATVATATFKGRTTSGTGNVEDLTATQATALLNAVVGDSGSGGTKGLVPAPTTGDSSKYLKGDGTWSTVSAGIGGSTGSTDRAILIANGTGGSSLQASSLYTNTSSELHLLPTNAVIWANTNEKSHIRYTPATSNDGTWYFQVNGQDQLAIGSTTGTQIRNTDITLGYLGTAQTRSVKGNDNDQFNNSVNMIFRAGNGGNNRAGGYATLQGGDGGSSANGGDVNVNEGNAGSGGVAGSVVIGRNSGSSVIKLNSRTVSTAANVATLTNSPVAGDPSLYLKIDINGTSYVIPAWTAP